MPDRWSNFIDLQTAIELFTPVYQLFLTDNDFWRATTSLQLDETIAIYVSRIIGEPLPLIMANNGYPMAPLTTLRAGARRGVAWAEHRDAACDARADEARARRRTDACYLCPEHLRACHKITNPIRPLLRAASGVARQLNTGPKTVFDSLLAPCWPHAATPSVLNRFFRDTP
jgi:hypothetical protein